MDLNKRSAMLSGFIPIYTCLANTASAIFVYTAKELCTQLQFIDNDITTTCKMLLYLTHTITATNTNSGVNLFYCS